MAFFMLLGMIALALACYFDLYEVNRITLLIPALKFKLAFFRYFSRTVYLAAIFLEFVVTMPILEQRFYFVFIGNILARVQIWKFLDFSRNSLLSQVIIYFIHYLAFWTMLFYSFDDDKWLRILSFAVVGLMLVLAHFYRAKYGMMASILVQMIFNFTLWTGLCVIYYSDVFHKGFEAEEFTTKRKNSIDVLFGHNENVEFNL